jgi:hypothetical protein
MSTGWSERQGKDDKSREGPGFAVAIEPEKWKAMQPCSTRLYPRLEPAVDCLVCCNRGDG